MGRIVSRHEDGGFVVNAARQVIAHHRPARMTTICLGKPGTFPMPHPATQDTTQSAHQGSSRETLSDGNT
jgi:hypothetical protein